MNDSIKRLEDVNKLEEIDLSKMTREFDIKKFYIKSKDIAAITITPRQIIIVCANSNINHIKILDKVLELISESNDKIPYILIYCQNNIFAPLANNTKGITKKQYEVVEAFYSMLMEVKDQLDQDFVEDLESCMKNFRESMPANLKSEQQDKTYDNEKIIGLPISECNIKEIDDETR